MSARTTSKGDASADELGGAGGDILALLDKRMKQIAEEVVSRHTLAGDVGAVKVNPTAMKMLDMSEGRVRALIREGKLKTINPTPRTVRVLVSSIRLYLEGEQQ